jgi:hypothetical protein
MKNKKPRYQDEDLLSVNNAAKFLGLSPSFLRTIKNRREIPYYLVSGCVRFKIADLKDYIVSCRIEVVEKEMAVDHV